MLAYLSPCTDLAPETCIAKATQDTVNNYRLRDFTAGDPDIASFILVFEMTDRQAAVVPMMAAALLANIAAKFVENESFYEKSRDQILAGYGLTHISEP